MSKWSAKRAYNIQLFSADNLSSLDRKEKLVYDIVLDIANKHGISMPEVGVYNAPDANAFATGASKNASLVAVSTGLLNTMNEKEIE
jgi:heat shock protein HtpX